MRYLFWGFFLLLGFLPFAQGNVIWPELFVSRHVFANFWLLIIMSLLVEWPFVKRITQTSWPSALVLTSLTNIMSMTIGQVVFVIGGFVFSVILEILLRFFGGRIEAVAWMTSGMFLAFVNAFFELGFLVLLSKIPMVQRFYQRLVFSRRNFWMIFFGNFLSALCTLVYISYFS